MANNSLNYTKSQKISSMFKIILSPNLSKIYRNSIKIDRKVKKNYPKINWHKQNHGQNSSKKINHKY